ncbi:Phosphoribosyl-ATP pyrophosphatase, partial [Dissostichus eleginoides]
VTLKEPTSPASPPSSSSSKTLLRATRKPPAGVIVGGVLVPGRKRLMTAGDFWMPTNYCPEEQTAVATIFFSFTAISVLLLFLQTSSRLTEGVRRESGWGSLSPRSYSLGESLQR